MECKGKEVLEVDGICGPVLIETLWNVKNRAGFVRCPFHAVLIETLWNVKTIISNGPIAATIVLIETLWNVKSGRKDTIETAVARINRNIMECKEWRRT